MKKETLVTLSTLLGGEKSEGINLTLYCTVDYNLNTRTTPDKTRDGKVSSSSSCPPLNCVGYTSSLSLCKKQLPEELVQSICKICGRGGEIKDIVAAAAAVLMIGRLRDQEQED